MSVDKAFRDMVRGEIESQVKTLRDQLAKLEQAAEGMEDLRNVVDRLSPLADLLGGGGGGGGGGMGARPAAKKAAAKPAARPAPKAAPPPPAPMASSSAGGKRRGRKPAEGVRICAIIGCGKPARTKGYCAAHYQKLRMLEKTNRRPSEWVDYAPPNSVHDLKLPRGRAAAKALAEASGRESAG
jgi:hypothetical protein